MTGVLCLGLWFESAKVKKTNIKEENEAGIFCTLLLRQLYRTFGFIPIHSVLSVFSILQIPSLLQVAWSHGEIRLLI